MFCSIKVLLTFQCSFTLKTLSNNFTKIFSLVSFIGKGKRWKNLYFILEGNDSQLIYFESEKRATKPKGLIDLSVCSVYEVHDSMFGRFVSHCIMH